MRRPIALPASIAPERSYLFSPQARRLFAAAALALLTPAALGQEAEDLLDEQPTPDFKFLGSGGLAWQGEADIDGGGTIQVNRYDAAVGFQTGLTEKLTWLNTFFVGFSDYEFGGGGFAEGNPWEKVLFNRYGTQLAYQIDEHWGVRAGGVFMFSRETDADWNDGFTGGGSLGVDYRVSETLFLSLGLGAVTQIEGGAKVEPSVMINWVPAEHWLLRVGAVPVSGGAAAGAEVEYQFAEHWNVGLGLLFNQRRFRLDDDSSSVVPNGVGEDDTLPLRLRLGWKITPQVSLNFLAGIVLGGQLQLDDQNGNTLREQDYDPAPYLGVRAVGRF
ncbi:MAG TPA: hypothetical protein PLX89_14645 [Verrucomicrobiota bacterium]|nr:hypothetical protein [Verrucomicrobiales bacterium]HRI14231.1 hypothetical protein [Verrucomicrobiota bacterium]